MSIVDFKKLRIFGDQQRFMSKMKASLTQSNAWAKSAASKMKGITDDQKKKDWDISEAEMNNALDKVNDKMKEMEEAHEDDWVMKRPQLESAVHDYQEACQKGLNKTK